MVGKTHCHHPASCGNQCNGGWDTPSWLAWIGNVQDRIFPSLWGHGRGLTSSKGKLESGRPPHCHRTCSSASVLQVASLKSEHRNCQCCCSMSLSHPCIYLCHGQEEPELTIGPPFCPPNTFQWNWSMMTFVNTLSTQCFALLCREKGLAYLNDFHSSLTFC